MDRGERSSSRTTPCPVARHRSRRRRRGSTSPYVTTACTGSRSACNLISLEEMDREPRASTLVGARASILANKIGTINPSRSITRCPPSSLFLDYVSLLADAFVRAAAGLLARGGQRAVEPVGGRAPLGVVLHSGSATRRDVLAGAAPLWTLFGRALRSCAALFMLVRFGATSFVATAALRLLVEDRRGTASWGRLEFLPPFTLVETRGLAAAPVETFVGHRWRVADDPMRHVLRMSAWNAMGWPERSALCPRWKPALSSVVEERARVNWAPSRTSVESPVGARWATRKVFSPRLERVEEEATTVPEAGNELPAELCGRKAELVPPDLQWTYVNAEFPTSASRRTASTDQPFELRNRFGELEVEETRDDEGAPIVLLDNDLTHLEGRPPGRELPRRGPRAPREVRDLESYLMRPVPMRRRSENEQVLGAHARFLQHWFRRTRALAAARSRRSSSSLSAWGRGGMRGLVPIYRPVHRTRCTDGIASESDFSEQRRRARRVLMWYRQYAELLRKLQGRQPELVDLFCGEGGVSEGIRRAGLSPNGVDAKDMPKYRDRFGVDRLVVADAYLPDTMRSAVERSGAVGIGASPPCQPYSTVCRRMARRPLQPQGFLSLRQAYASWVCPSGWKMSWVPTPESWRSR